MSEPMYKIGDRVQLAHLDKGGELDQYEAEKHLTAGKMYTIADIFTSKWGETRIELREIKHTSFNIVMFQNFGPDPMPRFHMYQREDGTLYCAECAGELSRMELMLLEEKPWSPTEFSFLGSTYRRPAWLEEQRCDICDERLWLEVKKEDDVA